MAQYIINSNYCSVFGMDVHARSVTVRGLNYSTAEMKVKRFSEGPFPEQIASWIKENFKAPYYAAYESGCTGFHLCRELRALGIDCDVIAVSSIARSVDDRQRKTDKLDAKRLLSELLLVAPTYKVVWTPDLECEAARDLARTRADAVDATKRAKQQTSALLLRHGYVWNEKTTANNRKKTWGREHWAWIDKIDLSDVCANEALEACKLAVRENTERVNHLSKLIEKHAQCPRWKPYVDALILLKGVSVQTAFLAASAFGDFSRFKNGKGVSKWLGTVPKESSSGEHAVHGPITKAGDEHLRCALTEGMANISRHTYYPQKLRANQVVSGEIVALANKANKRLQERHKHLITKNKLCANKAKIAIVSELVRWIWTLGLEVQKAQGEAM